MLEDTLIYDPDDSLSFAALALDLEGDGLQFFLRMSRDIGTIAAATNRCAEGADLADLLLTALVAARAERTAAWRRLYRGVRSLVAGFAPAGSGDASRSLSPAFRRLRQFVRENADLADTLAIVDFERSTNRRAIGVL